MTVSHSCRSTTLPTRQARRDVRRTELIRAAVSVFAARGVASASVDDIVRAAGVAKGTFYLYFTSKDEAVNAVAEEMVEAVMERVESIATDASRPVVDRLLSLTGSLREVGDSTAERELIAAFHRPENRAVHDRIGERAITRLAPIVAGVIADGIRAGIFQGDHPDHLAAFIMASLGSLHHLVASPSELEAATAGLNAFILRGLGYAADQGR